MTFHSRFSGSSFMAFGLTSAMLLAVAGQAVSASTVAGPSFDERVEGRRALEEVRWRHRMGPDAEFAATPALHEIVSDTEIRARVEGDLRKTAALASLWGIVVTTEMLQDEVDRIARDTHRPDRLRELFAALGDDPVLIAECIARPILVDRLIRERYARDERLHAPLQTEAMAALGSMSKVGDLPGAGNESGVIEWVHTSAVTKEDPPHTARARVLGDVAWARTTASLSEIPTGRVSALRESDDSFYVVGILDRDDERIRTVYGLWRKTPFDEWWLESSERFPALAPTGTDESFDSPEILGQTCADDRWLATPTGPEGRFAHTAVWTGNEMIVWGGFTDSIPLQTGGIYDPTTDAWSTVTTTGAPSARSDHTAVWADGEMIVWGGWDGSTPTLDSGGIYDPTTNSWSTMTTVGAPSARSDHTAVWTGTSMIVWGGAAATQAVLETGGVYDPVADLWSSTSTTGAPSARYEHTAIWTDTEMIVWGGWDGPTPVVSSGAAYDPAGDSWTLLPDVGAPAARWHHTAVWSGTEMIVWGGEGSVDHLDSGACYHPTDGWTTVAPGGTPSLRDTHTAVWSGTEMVVWGGWDSSTPYLDTGGRYDPQGDAWTATSLADVPEARYGHTAVWAETEMIVWGGIGAALGLDSGGRYCAGEVVVLAVSSSQDVEGTVFSWGAATDAVGYDVTRGDLVSLRSTGGDFTIATDICLEDNTTATSITDSDDPPAGDGFWYLVRPVFYNGPGTYDSAGTVQAKPRDAEIDASLNACP